MNIELFEDGSALVQSRRSAKPDDLVEYTMTAAQVQQALRDAAACRMTRHRVSVSDNRCGCLCCQVERCQVEQGTRKP